MPKTVGYITQNQDNTVGVPSVTVTQKLVGTNAATGVSASTDINGRYVLTNDEYPGMVFTDAVSGAQVIRRRGETVGQIGEIWSSDLVGFLDMFVEGVHPTVANALQVGTGSGMQVVMAAGSAITRGHPFIVTATKAFTIAGNALAVTRRDRIVLQLTRTGDLAGKIERLLVQGSTDGTLPALVQGVTIWQLPIATINVVQNAVAITGSDIVDDRVRFTIPSSVVAAGTVGTTQLVDGSVTSNKIGASAVGIGKIAAGAVGTPELGNNQISTAKLLDASVTTPKIATLAVTAAQIADATITGTKLATGTVAETNLTTAVQTKLNSTGSGTIADGSVTSAKIADGTIVAADIANATITEAKLASAVVTKLNTASSAQQSLTIKDESSAIKTNPTEFNFIGALNAAPYGVGEGVDISLQGTPQTYTIAGSPGLSRNVNIGGTPTTTILASLLNALVTDLKARGIVS